LGAAKRVLIISVKAGAGHIRAAQAIEAAFHEALPEVEVRNVDALDFTNRAHQALAGRHFRRRRTFPPGREDA